MLDSVTWNKLGMSTVWVRCENEKSAQQAPLNTFVMSTYLM